jgi:hypothetical protein
LHGCILEHPTYGNNSYDVDLRTLTSSARMLDLIMQIDGKMWASAACLSGLVRALDDILNPQANLCSSGGDKRLSAAQVARLVNECPRRMTSAAGEFDSGMAGR